MARAAATKKKAKPARRSKLGKELIESLNEATAWARGEIDLPVRTYRPPKNVPVGKVRKQLGLTQENFARVFGLTVGAIRDWEQDRRQPEGAARTLLAVIARHPEIVREVLSERAFQPKRARAAAGRARLVPA